MKDLCKTPFVAVPLDDPSIINNNTNIENKSYAMVSVPWQNNTGKLYSACEGLSKGTIFKDLDSPYYCSICPDIAKEDCNCG